MLSSYQHHFFCAGLEANATRKIMLVGHSVGGMVARAAPLLGNYPACAVRDIVQLSAPNTRWVLCMHSM